MATVPAPGEAPMPAANASALLRRNATDDDIGPRPAVRFGEVIWTHRQFFEESCRWAQLFLERRDPDRPFHVGVLLDNTPDYLFAFGGAALAGATIVGLNHTREGEHLVRDIDHTHVGLLVTEPRHLPTLAPLVADLGLGGDHLLVSRRFDAGDDPGPSVGGFGSVGDLEAALEASPDGDPGLDPDADTCWALIFTSGTSAAPKAVICSQRRLLVTGSRMATIMGIGPDDVGYVAMPLFHSNALMVGWAPALVTGASVGLARRFSASRWLDDVHHYRATYFNYTGKPLSYVVATDELPDDHDNSLRVAFGNEGSPQVVGEFGRRFGVEVIDAFGATEGGVALNRDGPDRPGALGQAGDNVRVVDDDGVDRAVASFDADGRLVNAEDCVGEIVNVGGAGPFEGYYNNPEATEATTRNGWYWSGDLGYLDADRYLYFAGRTADWIRVDGENFPAGPIEAAVSTHPSVVVAAVYGVPDESAGDQVMAAVVVRSGETLDPAEFAAWIDRLDGIGPKWRPRYVRLAEAMPTTGTNKVVKRELVRHKFRHDRVGVDRLWVRDRGESAYRPFTSADEAALHERFVQSGRERFWDL